MKYKENTVESPVESITSPGVSFAYFHISTLHLLSFCSLGELQKKTKYSEQFVSQLKEEYLIYVAFCSHF